MSDFELFYDRDIVYKTFYQKLLYDVLVRYKYKNENKVIENQKVYNFLANLVFNVPDKIFDFIVLDDFVLPKTFMFWYYENINAYLEDLQEYDRSKYPLLKSRVKTSKTINLCFQLGSLFKALRDNICDKKEVDFKDYREQFEVIFNQLDVHLPYKENFVDVFRGHWLQFTKDLNAQINYQQGNESEISQLINNKIKFTKLDEKNPLSIKGNNGLNSHDETVDTCAYLYTGTFWL